MKAEKKATIGKVWAIADHFEQSTGQPVSLMTLKAATGLERSDFRKWTRQGRLIEHRVKGTNGQEMVAYSRPKH